MQATFYNEKKESTRDYNEDNLICGFIKLPMVFLNKSLKSSKLNLLGNNLLNLLIKKGEKNAFKFPV